MRPLSSSGSGGGAGYCPRVCPRSAPSFSAIVLRRGDPTRDRGRKIGWCLAAGGRGLTQGLERAKGIEPSYAAWEAAVLPLNYARRFTQQNPALLSLLARRRRRYFGRLF